MTKNEAMEWAAKLIETIAHLPDDADINHFELRLNTDTQPYRNRIMSVQLCGPVKMPVITDGKRYSGWKEKRVWMKPDIYVWWSEDIKNEHNELAEA